MEIYVLKLEQNKWYIGKSTNVKNRINEHQYSNNLWIKTYKPLNEWPETFPYTSIFSEDLKVKEYMSRYGIENVRGGTYSSFTLTDVEIKFLEKEIVHANDLCFNCQGNHYIDNCPEMKRIERLCISCKKNRLKRPDYDLCLDCQKVDRKEVPGMVPMVPMVPRMVPGDQKADKITEVFMFGCRTGFLEMVQWSFHIGKSYLDKDAGFMLACSTSHFEIVKWLCSNDTSKLVTDHIIFKLVCRSNNFEALKLINSVECNTFEKFMNEEFIHAYTAGNLEIAKWLFSNGAGFNDEIFKSGHLEIIKWLYDDLKMDIHANDDEVFKSACSNGQIEIVKWLISIDTFNPDEGFKLACINGYFDIAQLLYSPDIKIEIFKTVCINGHLEVAKWLHNKSPENSFTMELFSIVCLNEHLEMVKWLYSISTITININELFRNVCQNGHVEVAKWLFNLCAGTIDIHIHRDQLFRLVCQKGNFGVISWLYLLGGIDIHMYNDQIIKIAGRNGHIEIVKWIYTLDETVFSKMSDFLHIVCKHGRIEIVKWLFSLNTISYQTSEVFPTTCANGHLELAKWLSSSGKVTKIHYKYGFNYACQNGHAEMAKWLYLTGYISNDDKYVVETLSIACKHNHYEVVKYLNYIGVNIHHDNDYLFRMAWKARKIEMIKLLYSFGKIVLTNQMFEDVSYNGNIELENWMFSMVK